MMYIIVRNKQTKLTSYYYKKVSIFSRPTKRLADILSPQLYSFEERKSVVKNHVPFHFDNISPDWSHRECSCMDFDSDFVTNVNANISINANEPIHEPSSTPS